MNGKTTVSAIVVTWNSAGDITACLNSLLSQSRPLDEIIVVDNHSQDGSAEQVCRDFPSVHTIPLNYNAGFAKGNNIGISTARGEWILFLNPDAVLEPNWLQTTLEFTRDRPRIGAVGGVLYREPIAGDREVIDSLGIEIYKSRRVRDKGAGEEAAKRIGGEAFRVFGLCAAAALYRRALLDDVAISGEVFPESFFCYYEDSDLAWRAWRRGWEAWVVPQAAGVHRRGGSGAGARFSRRMTQRNRLWMIARNDTISGLIKAAPQILMHEAILLIRMLRYPYLFGASLEAIAGLPLALKQRRLLTATSQTSPPFQPGTGFTAGDRKTAIQLA